jgi:two-component system, OmpR family, KDP operon response regulator KdpE
MTDTKELILLIEDEPQMRRFLRITLQSQGYRLVESETGGDGLTQAATRNPDVILLDLGLPDLDGLEVTKRLREWTETPIIVISAREQEQDKVKALDAGADDYLTKPFGVGELLARLRAALRHRAPETGVPTMTAGDLTVDLTRRLVTLANEPVQLTPTEYELLRVLMTHAGKVLTHRQLLREVWGAAYELETHLLRVNISNLRRKIEPEPARPQYILNEPGVGYRLRES